MKNRESLYPGRIKLTPVDAANGIYDLVRADEPQEEGTPLNKALLDYAVAACGVTAGTATALTLDDAFGGFTLVDGAKVNFRLHVASGANPTLNVNGTGAKAIITRNGGGMPSVNSGMWVAARYSLVHDAFVIDGGGGGVTLANIIIDELTYSINITIPRGVKKAIVDANLIIATSTLDAEIDEATSVDYITTSLTKFSSSGVTNTTTTTKNSTLIFEKLTSGDAHLEMSIARDGTQAVVYARYVVPYYSSNTTWIYHVATEKYTLSTEGDITLILSASMPNSSSGIKPGSNIFVEGYY